MRLHDVPVRLVHEHRLDESRILYFPECVELVQHTHLDERLHEVLCERDPRPVLSDDHHVLAIIAAILRREELHVAPCGIRIRVEFKSKVAALEEVLAASCIVAYLDPHLPQVAPELLDCCGVRWQLRNRSHAGVLVCRGELRS